MIVTAYASEESFANAITLGAMEYLRKPFLMGEVYALAERALRRRREKLAAQK
jgi:DNA-binding response OmpR family regulator